MKNETYSGIKGRLRGEGGLLQPPPGHRIVSRKERNQRTRPHMAEIQRDMEQNG